jgi:hypothetical protein
MNMWTRVSMLAFLMLCAAADYAATDVIVSISPSVTTVEPGQTVSVGVRVTDAYLLHGSSIVVRFNTAVLALDEVADGDVYTSVQPNPIFWWRPDSAAHADSVLVDQAILGAAVYSGSGTIFTVTFRAIAPGTSAVQLAAVDLRNNNNQRIDYIGVNGIVNVRSVCANIKAFLQGPYSSGSMTPSLATQGIIPLAQPYSGAPWSHTGSEAVVTVPSGVVDWVLVELRTGIAASTKAAVRAAFINTNGMIVDCDGTSAVGFPGISAGSYYVVVRHRNHLAVMSAAPVVLSATSALYDFTTGTGEYYGSDAKEVVAGVFALWAGDVTGNGIVKYNGTGNDRSPILTRIGGSDLTLSVNGYYAEDVNMNGQVKYTGTGNDRSIILQTIGGSDMTLTRSTNVPN